MTKTITIDLHTLLVLQKYINGVHAVVLLIAYKYWNIVGIPLQTNTLNLHFLVRWMWWDLRQRPKYIKYIYFVHVLDKTGSFVLFGRTLVRAWHYDLEHPRLDWGAWGVVRIMFFLVLRPMIGSRIRPIALEILNLQEIMASKITKNYKWWPNFRSTRETRGAWSKFLSGRGKAART